MIRRIITWTVVLILAAWFVSDPQGAAGLVTAIIGGIKNAASSFGTFATSLGG